MNSKMFRLKNLKPLVRNGKLQKEDTSQRDRLVDILTDVLKNIVREDDDIHSKSRLKIENFDEPEVELKQMANQLQTSLNRETKEGRAITISNEKEITKAESDNRFRSYLDPRDHVLAHPFKFEVKIPSHVNKHQNTMKKEDQKGQKQSQGFMNSQEYAELCSNMEDFIVQICENVVSIGFNYLNENKLQQNEAKDFAAKNILLNVKSVISQIISTLVKQKVIVHREEINNLKYQITKRVDQTLLEILKSLAAYYPQAPPTGGTPKMRENLLSVNRAQDEEYDLIFAHNIQIDPQEIKSQDYTEFIMKVINKAIQVTSQVDPNDPRGKTMFEKFTQFCENLFYFTQESKFSHSELLQVNKGQKDFQNDVSNHFQKMFSNISKMEEEEIQKMLINKEMKQEKSKFQEMLENVENGIEKLKRDKKFVIGQKIPSYVKEFSKSDLREKNLTAKNSAILRILTKWAEYLQQIFENPDKAINHRVYPLKTTANQLINPTEDIKRQMYQRMHSLRVHVANELKTFQNSNTLFQSEFLSNVCEGKVSSFVKRYTETRQVASKMNAVLIRLMVRYINTLIDSLVTVGKQLYIDFEDKNINLVALKVGDLMRSKIQCSESGFIKLLKTLYSLDDLDNHKFFKLVRIKNKLDSRDNNVLINFMFMGRVQCEMQVSIQSLGGKEKNYYSFSHFIYELTRGKFGALTECSIIVSQHDSVVAASKGNFYKAKRRRKAKKVKEIQKVVDKEQQSKKVYQEFSNITDANGEKMFACFKCSQLTLDQNLSLLKRKELPDDSYFTCNSCVLSEGKKENKTEQQLLKNQNIQSFIATWTKNKQIKKVGLHDLEDWRRFVERNETKYFIKLKTKNSIPELWCLWQHQPKSKYFFVKLSTKLLTGTGDSMVDDLQFKDVTEDILTLKPMDQFIYLCANLQDDDFKKKVLELCQITQACLATELIFTHLQVMANVRIAHNLFSSKSQILSVYRNKNEMIVIEDYYYSKKILDIQFIKRLYANNMELGRVPTIVNEWNHLKVLSLIKNGIKEIDLSKKKQLVELYLSQNMIQTIDLSQNNQLVVLYLDHNRLQGVNLQALHKIKSINLATNRLSSLKLDENPILTQINLVSNRLKEINVDKNLQLRIFYIATNKFDSINLTNNKKLNKFNAFSNSFKEIDLSENKELLWLRMSKNLLASMDMKNNSKINYLDIATNAYLESINLPYQPLLEHLTLQLDMNSQLQNIRLEGVRSTCQINLDCNSSTLPPKIREKYPQLTINKD